MFLPSDELAFGSLLPRVRQLLVDHRLRLPTNMVWLIKAVATAENTSRQLDPKFDTVEFVKPYTLRVLLLRFMPGQQLREILLTAKDSAELLSNLPYTFSTLVHQLTSGQFKVGLEHTGVDPATSIVIPTQRLCRKQRNRLETPFALIIEQPSTNYHSRAGGNLS